MSRKRKKSILSFFLIFLGLMMGLLFFSTAGATEENFDLTMFMNECQKMSSDPGVIAIVQWIPLEWWQLTLERGGVPKPRIEEVLELFDPYTAFIVIHGKINSSGLPAFTTEEIIRKHLLLVDSAGRQFRPINDEEVTAGVRNAIIMIKPIFSNMLGRMGENMNFYFFTGKKENGRRAFQARGEGSFSVYLKGVPEVKDQVFEWLLPLPSLLPVSNCPECKKEVKGHWKYCPWCGVELSPQVGAKRRQQF